MSSEWMSPGMAQAFATFGGAALVLCGVWYKDRVEYKSKSRNVRIQIAAEMRALLDVIEHNNYIAGLDRIMARLEEKDFSRLFYFDSTRNYDAVYYANLGNLGYLGEQAPDVVRFYMMLGAFMEDRITMGTYVKQNEEITKNGVSFSSETMARILSLHEGMRAKLGQAVIIGERVHKEL